MWSPPFSAIHAAVPPLNAAFTGNRFFYSIFILEQSVFKSFLFVAEQGVVEFQSKRRHARRDVWNIVRKMYSVKIHVCIRLTNRKCTFASSKINLTGLTLVLFRHKTHNWLSMSLLRDNNFSTFRIIINNGKMTHLIITTKIVCPTTNHMFFYPPIYISLLKNRNI